MEALLPAQSAIAVIQDEEFELDPSPETLNERQTAFALGSTLEEVRILGDRKILETITFGQEKHYWTESVRNLARARVGDWRWRAATQDPKSVETGCRLATLLTVTEARRELGNVSRTALYTLMAKGRLKTVKVGARRMIVSKSLEAWIRTSAEADPGRRAQARRRRARSQEPLVFKLAHPSEARRRKGQEETKTPAGPIRSHRRQ